MALLLVLFALGRDKLASNWELERGVLGYLPLWLLGCGSVGAVGGYLAAAEDGVGRPWWRPFGGVRGALFALFGLLVGWGVGGGRHLAAPGMRLGFALLVAAASVVGLGVGFRGLRLLSTLGQGRLAALLALVLACLCEIANRLILVRLYPAFHAGLSVLGVAAWGAAWSLGTLVPWLDRRPGRALGVLGGLYLGLLALVLPGVRSLARFDNFRWVLLETSPTLAGAVHVGALLVPSAPEASPTAPELAAQGGSNAESIDWSGRSVLLVTVDALRADHVGAYGYQRPTTPHLDALAQGGVVFDAAYAPTPHTSYSVLSLMTGKYMRPLLLQGAAADSDLWAVLLRTYGYKTAAFYPPAVFFIDQEKFRTFEQKHLGFEYFKVEFSEGAERAAQVEGYLRSQATGEPVFLWLHLFGPHEPYEQQPTRAFGPADIDRYDSEIAAADETLGRAVELMRARDPSSIVIVTADHGEEFGDHGGRYHGTTVYEEQVRVPLVIEGQGLAKGRRIIDPVQTIDLLPTVLSSMKIPVPPRLRGRDLGGYLGPRPVETGGLSLSETDELSLLAEGRFRLICHRPTGACRLFDLAQDPEQERDCALQHPELFERLRARARALSASHGRFESQGLRREGKGWPPPIVRGLAGEAEVAPELAQLLEDADRDIRAKAAEVLFRLATVAEAPALRLALGREEDASVRAWLALGLTRLGQAAPLVQELLAGSDQRLRRVAALALGLSGDDSGEDVLIEWWGAASGRSHEEDLEILAALAAMRSKAAVSPLLNRLSDVRLRVQIADTLAKIGDKDARPWLAGPLLKERYHPARVALANALLALGATQELVVPLRHFLAVPDPLSGGLGMAEAAGIVEEVGGPKGESLRRLRQLADSGVDVDLVVPPLPKGAPKLGARIVVRARSSAGAGGRIHLAPLGNSAPRKEGEARFHHRPDMAGAGTVSLDLPPGPDLTELVRTLPEAFGARPGYPLRLAVFAEGGVEIQSLAVLPLREEVPPPPPEPWEQQTAGRPGDGPDAPPR